MGCVISHADCPPNPCLPREAAECAALEADFLAALTVDGSATVLKSQRVSKRAAKPDSGSRSINELSLLPASLSRDQSNRRFVVLRLRGALGLWLEFLDVIPDPQLLLAGSGDGSTGGLPLEGAAAEYPRTCVLASVDEYGVRQYTDK
jgi:hypothetical protein